jgi:hypothetical protein
MSLYGRAGDHRSATAGNQTCFYRNLNQEAFTTEIITSRDRLPASVNAETSSERQKSEPCRLEI